jgi:hypothetical protein
MKSSILRSKQQDLKILVHMNRFLWNSSEFPLIQTTRKSLLPPVLLVSLQYCKTRMSWVYERCPKHQTPRRAQTMHNTYACPNKGRKCNSKCKGARPRPRIACMHPSQCHVTLTPDKSRPVPGPAQPPRARDLAQSWPPTMHAAVARAPSVHVAARAALYSDCPVRLT